jgi:DNA adenine methylase
MTDSFRTVTPIRPAAAYIGGKRRLGEQLARRIEAVPHETYVEPFIGMGGVFFRRRWAPGREVVNDVSRDVATLFRILQRHYPQFMESLKFQIASRAEFERLLASNPDTLTDLEWAGCFLYLQRLAFGGKQLWRRHQRSVALRCHQARAPARRDPRAPRRRRDRMPAVAGLRRAP